MVILLLAVVLIGAITTVLLSDTFVKRDDKYAKAYSALIKKAYFSIQMLMQHASLQEN